MSSYRLQSAKGMRPSSGVASSRVSRPSRAGLRSALPGGRPPAYADKKSEALKAKNTIVVSYSDLERIKNMCSDSNPVLDHVKNREASRKELHQVSQKKISAWPNTIEADRLKKEEDRIKKLEEEEMSRRQIDDMEEALRVSQRQAQLNRANKMLHDNQDQVKALHSKMLLCDVNTEQQIQIETKLRKKQLEKEIDQQWDELEKQKMSEYDQRVQEKAKKELIKKEQNSKLIQDQLYEYQVNYIKKMKQDKMEGKLMKK